MDSHNDSHQQPTGDGYEKRDVNIRKVLAYALSGLVILVILVVWMIDYFTAVREEIVYDTVLRPESAALRELRARETEELTVYRVVDSDKGIYQIPIERAMELLADEAYREEIPSVKEN